MTSLTRRAFVKNAALATAAINLTGSLRAQSPAPGGTPAPSSPEPRDGAVALTWLEGTPATSTGATLGVPWPRGRHGRSTTFAVRTAAGENVPAQTWPLAYWPDGSLKWSAVALPAAAGLADTLYIAPGSPANSRHTVQVTDSDDAIDVDTGVIRCRVAKNGASIIVSITRDGRIVARDGQLVALRQDRPEQDDAGTSNRERFTGMIEKAVVEQAGPIRAVVKLDGKHTTATRAWLPFSLRLYFYAGGDAVRIMHSFVFDGDEHKDFIKGLGVRFAVPLSDELHDRHVRLVGDGHGLFAEGVRNLTGLRRDAGVAVKAAQLAGKPCPPLSAFPPAVAERLQYIPAWGDYTLSQLAADAFQIRKRTKEGHGWIEAGYGRRSAGVGCVGGATGGSVAFGLRDFWQRHPTQLDIRGANTEAAEVTLWLYSPEAPAMDMRMYHDGLGQDTYEKQIKGGLEITYEDYEEGFGTPHGIARSSEITLRAFAATPAREELAAFADLVRKPPQLVCTARDILNAQVFGALWSLPDRSQPARAALEDRLDWQAGYYLSQIEQHHWYGFWNYGDVMHTYDPDRHVWRYDVGGYAWDNSELSPDLWLWYHFLRSGRADIFRMAEAMTRHTGEVDVYHLGRFAGLGTRHGVQHWSCSAKQVRISTAIYRRIFYYLTADERTGDLMREIIDADFKTAEFDPVRKVAKEAKSPNSPARISVGTDWCSFAANWLTEWERTGDTKYRDKIFTGMRDIGAARWGFFSGDRFNYDPQTGRLTDVVAKPGASHLSAVFGAVELCAELIQLFDEPSFENAWLQYCELYSGSPAAQQAALAGERIGGTETLRVGHSRLVAYAAWRRKDPQLAARAWAEFFKGDGAQGMPLRPTRPTRIEGPNSLNPIDEVPWVSTNGASQWGLAAIQNLALIPEALPADKN
jgi:hypothetical protein